MLHKRSNNKGVHFKDEIRRTFFTYSFVPIIIIIFIIYAVIYFSWIHTIETQNRAYNDTVSSRLNDAVSYYSKMAVEMSHDERIISAVNDRKITDEHYRIMYEIANKVEPKCHFLILDNGLRIIMSNYYSPPSYMYQKMGTFSSVISDLGNKPNDVLVRVNHSVVPQNGIGSILIGKAIKYNNVGIGYLIFDISGSEIEKVLGERASWNVVITDRYHHIAFTTDINFADAIGKMKADFRQGDGSIKVGDGRYFVTMSDIADSDIYIYTLTSLDFLKSVFSITGYFLIFVFVIIGFSLFFIAKYIANKETAVIDDIVSAMENVQNGDLGKKLYIKTDNEFKIIGDSFNKMLQDIQELIELNREEAKQSIISELKQLESQFNAHFLFNSLETLRYMIKFEPSVASEIVVSLSNLLRYSIDTSLPTVTLSEDIAHTENYLFIQKVRFNKRFDYFLDIDEKCRECIVPKLIVQPLIENAVGHNIDKCDRLSVFIKARILVGKLVITVHDDGTGIEKDELDYIRKMLGEAKNETGHIGLYNVSRRIRLMFGDGYGLRIKSAVGKGTIVKVFLPIQRGR